jgi:hypothetical protein
MPGLVPGIHEFLLQAKRGWPGQSPAMTVLRVFANTLSIESRYFFVVSK